MRGFFIFCLVIFKFVLYFGFMFDVNRTRMFKFMEDLMANHVDVSNAEVERFKLARTAEKQFIDQIDPLIQQLADRVPDSRLLATARRMVKAHR